MRNKLVKIGIMSIITMQWAYAITLKRVLPSGNDIWNEVINVEQSTDVMKEWSEDNCNKFLHKMIGLKDYFSQNIRSRDKRYEGLKDRLEGICYQLTFLALHYDDLHRWGSTLYKIFADPGDRDRFLKCAALEKQYPDVGFLLDVVHSCVAQHEEGYERFNASFCAPKMVGVLSWFANHNSPYSYN